MPPKRKNAAAACADKKKETGAGKKGAGGGRGRKPAAEKEPEVKQEEVESLDSDESDAGEPEPMEEEDVSGGSDGEEDEEEEEEEPSDLDDDSDFSDAEARKKSKRGKKAAPPAAKKTKAAPAPGKKAGGKGAAAAGGPSGGGGRGGKENNLGKPIDISKLNFDNFKPPPGATVYEVPGAPGIAKIVPNTKNTKENMSFEKGTYIFRITEDLEPLYKGRSSPPPPEELVPQHLWRIDNYQLLQRYDREKDPEDETRLAFPDDPAKYQRTQYYTGWRCAEKHLYLECKTRNVQRKEGKEEKLDIAYPAFAAIQKAIRHKDDTVAKEQADLEAAEAAKKKN